MSQVIVRRKAGQEIPKDYLALLVEKFPKVWGAAVVSDSKLEINHGDKWDIEFVTETLANFKDEAITFYFGETTSGTNLNDVPPFPIITNDDEEPLVALFLDGNFPAFDKAGSSFSPHYHLGIELMNTFGDAYDLLDKDLNKFMSKIGEKSFEKKMLLHSVSRGYIMVVAQNGGCVVYAQGDTAAEFPWGWTSNTLGYGAKAEAPPVEEKEKPKASAFPKRNSVREKFVAPSSNVVAAGADQPKKTETVIPKTTNTGSNNAEPPKTRPVILTVENISIKKFKVPGHLNRRARKAYLKERLGHVPPTWQNLDYEYEMYVNPAGAILTKKEIDKALGMSAAGLKGLDNPKSTGKSEDISPEHIDVDRNIPNPLPILSKNGRERLHRTISDERIRKIIGENASVVVDPDLIQGHEAKLPLLAQQMGMADMTDFDKLPFVEIERIGRNDIHDLAVMANTWRVRALKAELRLSKLEKKAPAAAPETPPTVKEEPPKSAFPKRKVA